MTARPSTYREQLAYHQRIGYRPPQGRNRCHKCGWHTPTMGHIEGCPEGEK